MARREMNAESHLLKRKSDSCDTWTLVAHLAPSSENLSNSDAGTWRHKIALHPSLQHRLRRVAFGWTRTRRPACFIKLALCISMDAPACIVMVEPFIKDGGTRPGLCFEGWLIFERNTSSKRLSPCVRVRFACFSDDWHRVSESTICSACRNRRNPLKQFYDASSHGFRAASRFCIVKPTALCPPEKIALLTY